MFSAVNGEREEYDVLWAESFHPNFLSLHGLLEDKGHEVSRGLCGINTNICCLWIFAEMAEPHMSLRRIV